MKLSRFWIGAFIIIAIFPSPELSLTQSKDEREKLLREAERVSDIRFPGAPAFRLQATFKQFGDIVSAGDGTYDEIWVSHEMWRRETSFAQFHRVEVGKTRAGGFSTTCRRFQVEPQRWQAS